MGAIGQRFAYAAAVHEPSRFTNLYPHPRHGLWQVLQWKLGLRGPVRHRSEREPAGLPPVVEVDRKRIASPDPDHVRATWIGHASFLIQVGGWNLLVDPVYSDHCAPVPLPRLRRKRPPGLPWEDLPPIDLVLITHSHFDHLDLPTLRRLPGRPRGVVPAGLAQWLARRVPWKVEELDWWQSLDLGRGLRVTSVPAQHFAARNWWDHNRSHWCGWVMCHGNLRVYATGDSGYCPVFAEIGERLGPMDVSLIPIGAYEPRWFMQAMHLNPEEAVQVHADVRSRRSLASHWGTFDLTDEPMGEPPERLARALQEKGLTHSTFRTLGIGETFTSP